MSISILKYIFECNELKAPGNYCVGIEFLYKTNLYSILNKTINNYLTVKRNVLILNFDINLYKFLTRMNENTKAFKYQNVNGNYTYNENNHFHLINCFDLSNMILNSKTDFLTYYSLNLKEETLKNTNIFICGLDLLNLTEIKEFFSINSKVLYLFNFVCYLFSVDGSSKNLNPINNQKKLFMQKQLNLFGSERNSQINKKTDKLYRLFEFNNLAKLTKENFIFEYAFVNNDVLPIFEKINLYIKEYKDIFEHTNEEEKKEEHPSSTFKLSLKENELKAKNEVVLPYLLKNESDETKEKKLKIMIDQEDLNELYDEEDPDGDLDI